VRRRFRLIRVCTVVVLIVVPLAARADDGKRIVVWPQRPGADVTGADVVVREAGFGPVTFSPIGERLRHLGERASTAEGEALDAVQSAFAAARANYLKQDFAGMADALERAEAGALPVLALPRHAAVLWELEFQFGLAELSRGNTAGAQRRFAFALELDEQRAPKRELYGPAVVRAFTEAADARTGVPPRPVAIRVTPRDARVVVDGLPVVDNALPRGVRPGLHVAIASAPGYLPRAVLVQLAANQPIELVLEPATGTAVERIGPSWFDGTLDPGTESGRRAIVDAAVEAGGSGALVIDLDRTRNEATARLLLAGDTSPVERRPTASAAAAAVLARLSGPAGHVRIDNGHARHSSVLRSWWLWTAVGVVAAASVGVVFATRGDDVVRVHSPSP